VTLKSIVLVGLLLSAAICLNADLSTSQPAPVIDAATSATGSAVPAKATYIAGNGTANLTGLTICNTFAELQMTTATTTQIVALSGSTKVRVCAISVQGSTTSTATTLKFVGGTGAACASVTSTLTPTWNFPASTSAPPWGLGSGIGEIFQTNAASALCATNSAAGTVNIFVTYTQY
jgi:hypothetical protein